MIKKISFFLLGWFLLALPVKAEGAARFYLEPASGEYSQGEEFEVAVWADPAGGEAVAIDAIISFDATRLEVSSVKEEVFFTQEGVGTNQGFNYDIDNDTGRVSLYSFATVSNFSVSSAGKIATITFKAKGEGTASVSFICQAGGDEDSSIWDTNSEDIVNCSSNGSGSYTIGGGESSSPTPTPTPTTASSPESPTPTPTALPETGIETPLMGVIIGGIIILGSGLLLGWR